MTKQNGRKERKAKRKKKTKINGIKGKEKAKK